MILQFSILVLSGGFEAAHHAHVAGFGKYTFFRHVAVDDLHLGDGLGAVIKIKTNFFSLCIMTHANGHFGSLTEKARLVTKAGGLYFPQVKLRKPWTLVVKTIYNFGWPLYFGRPAGCLGFQWRLC